MEAAKRMDGPVKADLSFGWKINKKRPSCRDLGRWQQWNPFRQVFFISSTHQLISHSVEGFSGPETSKLETYFLVRNSSSISIKIKKKGKICRAGMSMYISAKIPTLWGFGVADMDSYAIQKTNGC